MPNYNKVILIGHFTRDPQLSYTPNQTAVVDFGIATNRKWKGQDGGDREEVCFVDCRAFGKVAENINKFFAKGKPILIDGRLTFDQWEDNEGNKRSKHRITVETFSFVGGNDGQSSNGDASKQETPDSDLPF